ncbi:MAG: hypothetical protein ACI9P5_004257, partial [Saprospiraceae bacterium]
GSDLYMHSCSIIFTKIEMIDKDYRDLKDCRDREDR